MIDEDMVEQTVLATLGDLNYSILSVEEVVPDAVALERHSYSEVVLYTRLVENARRLNPTIPEDTVDEAMRLLLRQETPSLVEENRRVHRMMVDGIDVEFSDEDGTIKRDKVWIADFSNPANNDWVAINQFTVGEGKHNRRPDVVVFLNGLPVAVIELKSAGAESATIEAAFNQIQTYKQQIPSLFRTNGVLVVSDGLVARVGSLTADQERFMPWRSVTGETGDFTPSGPHEMNTLLRGVFDQETLTGTHSKLFGLC